jgi:AcrR family transcriptional regulator
MTGLRERKKARTRASLREHALRLFRDQGYDATTVEQIAAAAEVSPSTFFRYFPTKEDVLLRDDFEVRAIEAFDRQPPGMPPLAAMRAAIRESVTELTESEWADMRLQAAIAVSSPDVRARTIDEMARTTHALTEALGQRVGLAPDDLRVRALVGAVMGIVMVVGMPYETWAANDAGPGMFDDIDKGLALLERGLPLS